MKIENKQFKLPKPLPLQPEELDVLAPRERLSCAEWAEKYRKLSPKTTNLSGDWSHEYTPFAIEIMESLSDVGTRQVTVMKSSQSAGTETGLNFIGWAIEEAPGPLLVVMPREDDANRRVNTRIKPMFESTPSLRRHLYRADMNEINIGKETVLDNMIMYLAWAGSAAALADNPVCYVILDEVGKFPVKSGKEADPVSLAKDRQRTFYARSKLYCPSTPVLENDLIDREYKDGDRRKWWAKCPHCGGYHVLIWENVKLGKTENGKLLDKKQYAAGGHARYVCPKCGVCWNEQDRWRAVSAGRWAPEGCTVDDSGRLVGKIRHTPHRSYHITALMLYPGFQTVDRLAAEWASAQDARKRGDIGPLQNFINSQLAEPWKETERKTELDTLMTHIGNYQQGIVPEGVQLITAGIDVQLDHVWVSVVGWGFMSEAWGLWEQRIETGDTSEIGNLEILRQFLSSQWPLAENPEVRAYITKAAIDCNYRTDQVIDFCRKVTEIDIVPVRGDDTVKTRMFRAVKIAGGTMNRYDLNVNMLKSRLYRLLYESNVQGAGYFHMHRETTEETLSHRASEEERPIRQRGRTLMTWIPKAEHLANHIWDCDVYAAFAAELAGARTLADPGIMKKEKPKPLTERKQGFLDGLPKL